MVIKTQNKNNIIIIYFDPNNKIDDLKKRLDQVNDDVVFYTELESCITFIQSIEKQKIFLIIPSSSSQILSHIIHLHQVEIIFIFCLNNDQYKHLFLENPKVIGIYNNVDLLCSSIQKQINCINKNIPAWCFFDQNDYTTEDLFRRSSDFLWLQLFHDVLLHLPRDGQAKKQMIDACRYYYQDNLEGLKLLDEFEHKYESKEALRWFLVMSCLQKMINKALQTEDIDLLYTLRYFLADLLENLAHKHQQTIESNQEKLIVYRQMKLSNDEFKQLQENKDKLILMKGFLIAHTDSSSPLALSTSSIERTDLISVLFEIECNIKELSDNLIFADITQFNQLPSCQKIILFDFNTTFRLENVQQNEQMWLIKLNAVCDGRSILRKYIDDTHRQIEDLSIPIIFGKLICDMGQWNQSQIYFEHLLNDSHDEDLVWIEHSIGQVHHWKAEWNEARIYYDRAYDRMMNSEPARIRDSALILSDIGEILYLQGKYEEAYEFHQRALTIRKKYYSSSHAHIANSLENIGVIHYRKRNYDQALVFHKQALSIREEYYNHFHVDIAMSLNNIGDILNQQGKNDEALDYHRRAVSIYEKYYPSGHILLAMTFHDIGYTLYRKKKYDEALDIAQRALTMQKTFYPFDHINIGHILNNIGNIKDGQEKYDESLQFYQQALTIRKKYYLSDHLNIACTLNNIGDTQLYGKENYEALHYHQQALTILETSYPLYHGDIAMTLNYIGNVLRKQEKHDEALNYYQRALAISEKCRPSYHMDIINSLQSIGDVRFEQKKFDEALVYYLRAVAILERFHPMNYTKILTGLEVIANILYKNSLYSRTIEYGERCLRIREASFSLEHLSIAVTLSDFGQLHRIRDEYELSLI
jgi:tetratricopeptide (TPR) repeat protein